MNLKSSLTSVTVGLALGLFTSHVFGQEFNAEMFRHYSPGVTEVVGIENDEYLEPGQFSLGWAGIYSHKPITLKNVTLNSQTDVISDRGFHELSMAIGLRWFEVGFAIPMTIYQTGESVGNLLPQVDESGLGDIRVVLRRPLGPVEERGVNVGVSLTSEIPSSEVTYTGETKFSFIPQLLTQYRTKRFSLIGNVGGHVRFSDSALNFQVKSGLRFAAGFSYNIPIDGLGAFAHVLTEITALTKSNIPVEGTVGLRYAFDPRITLLASYGRGIVSGVGAPQHRGVLMLSLQHPAKRNLRLPNEEKLDEQIQAIAEPEPLPPDPAPEQPMVFIRHGKIQTKEKIYFATAKDVILPESIPTIDALADKMKRVPAIRKIRIEGHTDSRGTEISNLTLSQKRADSVRRALIERGVEADRMIAVGFGEVLPIDSNTTEEGMANNRRVEFVILETEFSTMEKRMVAPAEVRQGQWNGDKSEETPLEKSSEEGSTPSE